MFRFNYYPVEWILSGIWIRNVQLHSIRDALLHGKWNEEQGLC